MSDPAPDSKRHARYHRQRACVIGLLVACLALLVTAFTQSDRLVLYDAPLVVRHAGKDLLVCEERTVLEQDPTTAVRDLASPGEAIRRLVGKVVAAQAQGDALYLALPTGLSVYDAKLARTAFVPLPSLPPKTKPDPATTVLELLALRELDGQLRVVARTEKGLVTGRLAQGKLAFGTPTTDLASNTIRAVELVRVGGRAWAAWIATVDADTSRFGCARLDGDALVDVRQHDVGGLVSDFAVFDGAPGESATFVLNRRSADMTRLAVTPFDPAADLAPRAIDYEESAWPRGPVLGLAAIATADRADIVLARMGSLERIHAPTPRQTSAWAGPEHLAGIGSAGRLTAFILIAFLVACSILVVIAGMGLLRDRPPRLEMVPPFRLAADSPPAPLWLRGSSFALDMILVLPALVALGEHLSGTSDFQELSLLTGRYPLHAHLLFCAIYLPYDLGCELLFGGSVGKLLFGLRVVDPAGNPPSRYQVLVRSAAKVVDTALLLGVLPMLVTPLHQRFGDIWADTLVVTSEAEDEEDF